MDTLSAETALTIVPQPPPPGLYVTIGPQNLVEWALENISKTLADPSRIVWVDGANAFNAYLVALAARAVLKDSERVLRSYHVARPFTAYQLEAMVSEKLLPASRRINALICVIADPLRLFADAQGRDTQIRQCFNRFIIGLQAAATETAILVLAPNRHPLRPPIGHQRIARWWVPRQHPRGMTYEESLLENATRVTKLEFVNHNPVLSLV